MKLGGDRSARASLRGPLVASAIVTSFTIALIPVASEFVGPTVSFLPAVLTAVMCFDVICLYLLAGDFFDGGDRRILLTSWAYLFSLIVMLGYAMAFPGVFSADPPLASAASVAPYLYLTWHAGFPVLLGIAWAPWPTRFDRITARNKRRQRLFTTSSLVTAASVLLVAACVRYGPAWPVLIDGTDTSGMVKITAPIALPLVLVSLILVWRGVNKRTGPERWVAVAVLVCLCDLVLTYSAIYRYSVGWYAGRTLTMVSAAVLLVAMLASFRRLKTSAEFNAAFDALTGLSNRRNAHDILERMVARAHRSVRPLSVITLDLDHFKQINDRYGHPAGDAVLAAVGAALAHAVREGDVPARVGGEEFLVLLPDTGEDEAGQIAERLRFTIASLDIPEARGAITASFGVNSLAHPDAGVAELLDRADVALYQAKRAGRNCVETAPAPGHEAAPSATPQPNSV